VAYNRREDGGGKRTRSEKVNLECGCVVDAFQSEPKFISARRHVSNLATYDSSSPPFLREID
jgi:hypothetical protein